jgi:hypothetical protein
VREITSFSESDRLRYSAIMRLRGTVWNLKDLGREQKVRYSTLAGWIERCLVQVHGGTGKSGATLVLKEQGVCLAVLRGSPTVGAKRMASGPRPSCKNKLLKGGVLEARQSLIQGFEESRTRVVVDRVQVRFGAA